MHKYSNPSQRCLHIDLYPLHLFSPSFELSCMTLVMMCLRVGSNWFLLYPLSNDILSIYATWPLVIFLTHYTFQPASKDPTRFYRLICPRKWKRQWPRIKSCTSADCTQYCSPLIFVTLDFCFVKLLFSLKSLVLIFQSHFLLVRATFFHESPSSTPVLCSFFSACLFSSICPYVLSLSTSTIF